MADEFFLDKDRLDAVMTEFQEIGKRIGAGYGRLSDVLLKYDGAWGNDEIGKAFAQKYLGERVDDGVRADVAWLAGAEENIVKSGDTGKVNAEHFAGLDQNTARTLDLQ